MDRNKAKGLFTLMAASALFGSELPSTQVSKVLSGKKEGWKQCPTCKKWHNRHHWEFCKKECEEEYISKTKEAQAGKEI